MSNGLMKYDDAIINAALDDLQVFIKNVEQLVDDAKAAVNKRMQVADGQYAAAFTSAENKWTQAVTNIKVVTGNFAGALSQASETMSSTDKAWAGKLDSIG